MVSNPPPPTPPVAYPLYAFINVDNFERPLWEMTKPRAANYNCCCCCWQLWMSTSHRCARRASSPAPPLNSPRCSPPSSIPSSGSRSLISRSPGSAVLKIGVWGLRNRSASSSLEVDKEVGHWEVGQETEVMAIWFFVAPLVITSLLTLRATWVGTCVILIIIFPLIIIVYCLVAELGCCVTDLDV